MNSKEVVVIFENGIHPSQQEQYQVNHHHHEQQQQQQQVAAVDTMTQRVQALRLAQQESTIKNTVHVRQNHPWQFPQPSSNKENEIIHPQHHSTTAMVHQ